MLRPVHAVLGALALLVGPGAIAAEVNLYTTREPGLIRPLLERYTAETGTTVNTVFVQGGLAERVAAEGARSPADMLMVVDMGNVADLLARDVVQPHGSAAATAAVPEGLRDAEGRWTALSARGRAIYVSRERVAETETLTYEGLADPRWRGRVCIRSGQHPYNTFLFAALLQKHGEEWLADWLTKLKANLARRPSGGDREVARDILAGQCDIGVGNTYYGGLMLSGRGGEEQVRWGQAIRVVLPSFADGSGTQVNISAAAIAKHAPNRAEAVKLLEFLLSPEAQEVLARANFEFPVRPGVAADPIVAGFGTLRVDATPLPVIAERRAAASRVVDRVGFDQ